MISKYAAVAAVGLLCLAGQASAMNATVAQLGTVKGSVMINQGGAYVKASSGTVLRAGDRIVAMEGGAAQLQYADGCSISVGSTAMATVGASSPCGAGLVRSAQPAQLFETDILPLIIVTAIIIAGAIAISDGPDDPPTSP
jgi:hypothetical protein